MFLNCAISSQLIVLLLFLSSTFSTPYYLTQIEQQSIHDAAIKQENKPYVIVIDPGHGGKDLGCNAHTHEEKSFTLPFALKLGDKIQHHSQGNIKVLYTRVSDISVSLSKRTEIANTSGADLFISIHANSIHDPDVHGFEAYVYGNSTENLDTTDEPAGDASENNEVIDYILTNMVRSNYLHESIKLARVINKEMSNSNKLKNRGVKQAEFRVLKNAEMPSILLEMGYLTNQKDIKLLQSNKGQNVLADNLAKAILEYLKLK